MPGSDQEKLPRVLLVDDEKNVLTTLGGILRRKGFCVDTAASGKTALEKLASNQQQRFEVVLTDFRMPEIDGPTLLRHINFHWPTLPVIVLTGYGSIRGAIETIRAGAFEYLVKPANPDEVIDTLRHALATNRTLDITAGKGAGFEPVHSRIIGSSPAFAEVLAMVDRFAKTELPVLLTGESGTGKELIARAIHESSHRASGPFVPVNCAAINPSLAETTFFGHRRGAFTGADAHREGVFQAARGGTLFLDEISDFPASAQGVLLRALQEGSALPVGAVEPESLDVRVVCATNRNIIEEVRENRFRQDLYFRINTIELTVPPLRDRLEDIPELVAAFLARGGHSQRPTTALLQVLLRHDWPGNVRELRNVIERAAVLCAEPQLDSKHLPTYLSGSVCRNEQSSAKMSRLDLAEIKEIRAALSATGGVKQAAAKHLGIDRKRLYRKMRRHGLS